MRSSVRATVSKGKLHTREGGEQQPETTQPAGQDESPTRRAQPSPADTATCAGAGTPKLPDGRPGPPSAFGQQVPSS